MSVYIKGMKMPTTESEVLIIAIESDGSVYPVRIDGDGQPMIFQNEEIKNCAIPIPPHGDLIDRDALPWEKQGLMLTDPDEWGIEARYIEAAPTIIPADELFGKSEQLADGEETE